MGTTSLHALRWPTDSDAADGPQALEFLADDVDGRLACAFECTSSTRPTPVSNRPMIIRETDTGNWLGWNGTAWVALASSGGGGGTAFTTIPGQWRASSAQSIPDSTDTVLAFGTSEITSAAVTRATSGTGHRFTVDATGTYAIAATVRWANGGDGRRFIELRNVAQDTRYPGASDGHRVESDPCTLSFSTVLYLAADTELVVIGSQDTGAALALEHTGSTIVNGFVRLAITRIG